MKHERSGRLKHAVLCAGWPLVIAAALAGCADGGPGAAPLRIFVAAEAAPVEAPAPAHTGASGGAALGHDVPPSEPGPAHDAAQSGGAAPNEPAPWSTGWVPADAESTAAAIDSILNGTGLAGQGRVIFDCALRYGVNPAFALAMFRKEASFARSGTRAHRNKNPGNIIATGACRQSPAGRVCRGVYGEVGTDGSFGVYARMEDGIRAFFKLLSREYKPDSRRGCTAIACVIESYCPAPQSATAEYIAQVAAWTGEYERVILSR